MCEPPPPALGARTRPPLGKEQRVSWKPRWEGEGGGRELLPLAESLVGLASHSPEVQALEVTFFRCLCFAALPNLIVAAASSFFAGRGDSWTVLSINFCGLVVNAVLDYAWIFGHWGFPAW